jgi:hypothetical protein
MEKKAAVRTITEPDKEVRVCRECDLVVVGGSPGGPRPAAAIQVH